MEKKKISFGVMPEPQTRTFEGKNGTVTILNWIPAAEKEAFAREFVELTMGTDDGLGICYKMMTAKEVEVYLYVKYYTDIDVSDIKDMDGIRELYDYCSASKLEDAIWAFVPMSEVATIENMAKLYWEAVQRLYETEHSLANRVKELLATDPDTNNAETRELIEKLIDMKGALAEKEAASNVLQFGKKKSTGVQTGGVKMNLAKRN